MYEPVTFDRRKSSQDRRRSLRSRVRTVHRPGEGAAVDRDPEDEESRERESNIVPLGHGGRRRTDRQH
jgi:hypothetical protein